MAVEHAWIIVQPPLQRREIRDDVIGRARSTARGAGALALLGRLRRCGGSGVGYTSVGRGRFDDCCARIGFTDGFGLRDVSDCGVDWRTGVEVVRERFGYTVPALAVQILSAVRECE